MNVLLLLITSNAATFFVGWLFGKTGRNAAIAATTATEVKAELMTRPFRMVVIGMMAISSVTAGVGVYVASTQSRFADCVSDQFNELLDTLKVRSESGRVATRQLDAVMQTIVDASRKPSTEASLAIRTAIEDYVAKRAAAEKDLRQHPYPDPPRDACRH